MLEAPDEGGIVFFQHVELIYERLEFGKSEAYHAKTPG